MPLNYRTEAPTNEDRAAWAQAAVEAFARQTRGDVREHVVDDTEGLDEILGDLLCDARHLAAAYGVDFDALVQRGLSNWREDRRDEIEDPVTVRIQRTVTTDVTVSAAELERILSGSTEAVDGLPFDPDRPLPAPTRQALHDLTAEEVNAQAPHEVLSYDLTAVNN